MRSVILFVPVIAAIAASYYGIGRLHPSTPIEQRRRVLYYVDPMHPSYRSDKPGIAPDCGMQLEPVYGDTELAASSPVRGESLLVDAAAQRRAGIRVAPAERSGARRAIKVVGRVQPDDTRVYTVNSGVDGFIRATYEDSTGMMVKKDQKLAAYYSPDFLAVASGFLAAVQNVPGATGKDGSRTVPFPGALSKQGVSSLQGYIDRLRNLGMSDLQIQHVAEGKQLPESIEIVSPVDGYIMQRNVSPGQHFMHGAEFYRIADLSRVWISAEVYSEDAIHLRGGDAARVTLREEGRQFTARVSANLPQSEPGGPTVRLRLDASNPESLLRPGRWVDVEFTIQLPAGVTVPIDALVHSGEHARVYVQQAEGSFEPREVEIGWRSEDRVEVRRGLRVGEQVVVAAAYLVDSETRLQALSRTVAGAPLGAATGGPAKESGGTADPNCGMRVDPAKAAKNGLQLGDGPSAMYFCSTACRDKYRKALATSAVRKEAGL